MNKVNEKYSHLFEPIKIGALTMKNRIFCAPTGSSWGLIDYSTMGPESIEFYEEKARGGAAVVTMGECIVHSATGKSHDKQFIMDGTNSLASLSRLARAIRRHGAIPNAELSHGGIWGGLKSLAGVNKKGIAYGPSEMTLPQGKVLEMPKDLILEIIDSFGNSASMLQRAGFEMCMVHGGHGWLLGQFLSPRTNHRTDEFGGPLENRAKMLLMVLDAVRKATGPAFPIEVRISGDEFTPGGLTQEDGIAVAKMIQDKCDLINVSASIHQDPEHFIRMHPSQYIPKGPNVYLAEAVRKEVRVPISTVGAIVDPELMEDIIASGKADVVELGRPLVADPQLPQKIRSGREKEVFHCIRCNNCFGEGQKSGVHACTINPVYTNGINSRIALSLLPKEKKKVMIVGGGPGGMKAALTAAERGHDVVLYEKDARLGGNLNFAKNVEFKRGLYDFKETLEYLLKKNDVRIVLNTAVDESHVEAEKPDALFIANGAVRAKPPIRGIDNANVCHAADMFDQVDSMGERIVVLGGGFVGCEAAAYLGRIGKNVTLIEMRNDIALDSSVFERAAMRVDMQKTGVDIMVNTRCESIAEEGVVVIHEDGRKEIVPADNILYALGFRTNDDLFVSLANSAPIVQRIGDCKNPGKVFNAVSDGYYLALDL